LGVVSLICRRLRIAVVFVVIDCPGHNAVRLYPGCSYLREQSP
jgi:hypothetical protein